MITFIQLLNFLGSLSTYFRVLKDVYKRGKLVVRQGKKLKRIKLPGKTWAHRFWAALISILTVGEITHWAISVISRGFGVGFLAFAHWFPNGAMKVIEQIAKFPVEFEGMANYLASTVMRQITGVAIEPIDIKPIEGSDAGRIRASDLGGQYMRIIEHIFSIPASAKDFETRSGNSGSLTNLAAFFGVNIMFQLRSLTIATVACLTGWPALRYLEALHQSINWAFGFGWLTWSVMSQYLEVAVFPGVKRELLAAVRPNDFTTSEALWAWWAGFINDDTLLKILDNQGHRIDIREALKTRAQADLTIDEIRDLYDHQRLKPEQVLRMFREKGYGAERAQQKFTVLSDRRTWDILDDITKQYFALYRDCVIDKAELHAWLAPQGWSDAEIDLKVADLELARRQRKWLTESDLDKLLDRGVLDVFEVHDYLVCQGMTELDAAMKILLMLEKKFPKDCWDKITPGDISAVVLALLTSLFGKGVFQMPAGLVKFMQCLGHLPFPLPIPPPGGPGGPGGPPEGKPPKPVLPSVSFSTLPSTVREGEQFRLVWRTEHADTVEIDNGIGPVEPDGVRFLTATVNTVWTLTAKNKDGVQTAQASILVRPKPEEKPPKPPKPTAALTLTPKTVTEGDTYAVVWETTNADDIFLDEGTGPRRVSANGGYFAAADHNRIFTLTAAGPGGQRSDSEALVVRPQPTTGTPKPTASVHVSPGRAHVGEQVEVGWTTSNADRVLLEIGGKSQRVSAAGALVITAEQTSIITLRAANTETGVERIAQDALIILPEAPPTPPTIPPPFVSLTVSPSRMKGPGNVDVVWYTERATEVTLMRLDVVAQLELSGSMKTAVEHSDLFVLRAKGAGGETVLVRAVIVV
jgi:hypothetical protein